MKKLIITFSAAAFALSACGKEDSPRKLSRYDIARAAANAKQYFTRKYKGLHGGQAWEVQGVTPPATALTVMPTASRHVLASCQMLPGKISSTSRFTAVMTGRQTLVSPTT